jgi:hypothetical protein
MERFTIGFVKTAFALALLGGAAWAQTQPVERAPARFEVGGIAGGSALLSRGGFDGADGLWGVKAGLFGGNGRRLGIEGSVERSAQYRDLTYLGGDFVYQFTRPDARRVVPFLHAGLGAFLYELRAPRAAVSFGGGVKIPLGRYVSLRFGAQDRILLREGAPQRFDLYGGVFFRF